MLFIVGDLKVDSDRQGQHTPAENNIVASYLLYRSTVSVT